MHRGFGRTNNFQKTLAGNFHLFSKYETLLKQVEAREDITSIERMTLDFWNLVDSWIYMLLIVVVFASEWFLKRYFGAY